MYNVTAVIVNYNGGQRLLDTLLSLKNQADVTLRILIFDDGSTDESIKAAEETGLADVIHRSAVNTKNANKWRATGMESATTDLVLVTDNDVAFESDCLATLARTFAEDSAIAAVTPAIYDCHDPDKPHSIGGMIHFLGLTTRLRDRGETIVDSVGAGITMYSKSRVARVGTYDKALAIGWGDDSEFHQRIRLAGLRSVVNRTAKIFHEFKPFSNQRSYRVRAATYNRLRFIATHYSTSSIIGLLPLLIGFEVFLIAVFAAHGLMRPFMSGLVQFGADFRQTMHRRKFIQGLRRVPDGDLLCGNEVFIPAHARVGPFLPLVRLANFLLSRYWHFVTWLANGSRVRRAM